MGVDLNIYIPYKPKMINLLPTRTCAGTGEKHPQAALMRFVNVKGVPTPECLLGYGVPGGPKGRAPGRGVYVLPTPEALAQAIKRKVFAHRLRTNQPPPPWEAFAPLLKKNGQ